MTEVQAQDTVVDEDAPPVGESAVQHVVVPVHVPNPVDPDTGLDDPSIPIHPDSIYQQRLKDSEPQSEPQNDQESQFAKNERLARGKQ